MLQIIHHAWPKPSPSLPEISIFADRLTLAKRRWHASAEDGASFGFDLESHLHAGDVIFETPAARYVLAQKPEPILEIALGDPAQSARAAWSLGNLHFPIAVHANTIQVVDDPAVRLYLERAQIKFHAVEKVFHPLIAVSSHAHGHAH